MYFNTILYIDSKANGIYYKDKLKKCDPILSQEPLYIMPQLR